MESKARDQGEVSALEYYHKNVAQSKTPSDEVMLVFSQGARFGVSRAQILSRSKAFYQNLLKTVSGSDDPAAGYWLEYMWHDVFHPEALQHTVGTVCELPKK